MRIILRNDDTMRYRLSTVRSLFVRSLVRSSVRSSASAAAAAAAVGRSLRQFVRSPNLKAAGGGPCFGMRYVLRIHQHSPRACALPTILTLLLEYDTSRVVVVVVVVVSVASGGGGALAQ